MPSEAVDVNAALTVTAELGAALTATTSLAELVALLGRQLKWLLPIQTVALALLEPDGESYRLWKGDQLPTVQLLVNDVIGWSLRHRTGLSLGDVRDPACYPPGVMVAPAGWTGSLLTNPLATGEAMPGALILRAALPGTLQRLDTGLVHLTAQQVSSAVRVALLIEELDGAEAIIASMARAVEAKDPYTAGHSDRVTRYALALAEEAHLSLAVRAVIARSGPLHDVGKIGIPDAVLRKPDRLDDEEYRTIQQHPVIGDEICRPLVSLQRLRHGIRHHHERYDGQGYPDGLAGTDIPLEARVLAIADTFDAMTSSRPYRSGMPIARAMKIITENDGPQWDPGLVAVFRTLHSEEKAA